MSKIKMIATRKLRKEYDQVVALSALDLEVEQGEIYGLIGPNGAGKSTLLKILATVLRPDFGSAAVAGFDVERAPLEARRRFGFMPDFFGLYESVTVEDFLTYFGLAYKVELPVLRGRVRKLLELVNLEDKQQALISELSRGMRQRLVFAKTLIHDPPVLLLDEPLSGLDPQARMEMREILRTLKSEGKTVVISSHILPELSDFCTSVGILEKGVLRITGSVAQIMSHLRGDHQVLIEVAGEVNRAKAMLEKMPGLSLKPAEGQVLRFSFIGERGRIAEINAALVNAGIGVMAIKEERGNIEDIYFQVAAHEVQ